MHSSLMTDTGYDLDYQRSDRSSSTWMSGFQASKSVKLLFAICTVLTFVISIVIGFEIGKNSHSSNGNDEPPQPPQSTITLLVSIDGFRPDYLDMYADVTPNLRAFRSEGLSAHHMQSSFPSTTFPNHWSIVTGLIPPHHGIVSNNMFDPVMNLRFSMKSNESKNPAWWQGEPIWKTAERNGLSSATAMWPGSEAIFPTHWLTFNQSMSSTARTNHVLTWLDAKQCSVCTLYFDTVDTAGHTYGPQSAQVKKSVADIDVVFGYLFDQLRNRGMYDTMSIVIVSDHGMSTIRPSNQSVFLSDNIDINNVTIIDQGAFLGLWPTAGVDVIDLYKQLVTMDHAHIFLSSNMPSVYQYQGNVRIPPIVGIAEDGWVISPSRSRPYSGGGTHGYDPHLSSMSALFLARSPMLKTGIMPEVRNVHVYSLMCHLLGINGTETDGTLDVFNTWLA